jgi:7,8-dihydroneopterin aldolase/epimerase/oxygenase
MGEMSGHGSESESSDDCIHIEQLEIFARVGVPDEERATRQRLTINLTLWPRTGLHELNDDLGRTINYSAVAQAVREFVIGRHDKLIETLAEQVAGHLLARFQIRRIRIELRKFVLPDAEFVSVTLTRSNQQT